MGMQMCCELSSLLSISVPACHKLDSSEGMHMPATKMCMLICSMMTQGTIKPTKGLK